jgi:hypothetical protein
MSAVAHFADSSLTSPEVREVPIAAVSRCSIRYTEESYLLDHLVGAREQLDWRIEAERFGGLQIDRQLELGCELDRQVARLFALENAIDIGCRASEQVGAIAPYEARPPSLTTSCIG